MLEPCSKILRLIIFLFRLLLKFLTVSVTLAFKIQETLADFGQKKMTLDVGFLWLSNNALVSIDVRHLVTLRRARLVPGWVTVFGRVNHLGAKPSTQVNSAWAIPSWVGEMSTQQKLGSKYKKSCDHTLAHIPGFTVLTG